MLVSTRVPSRACYGSLDSLCGLSDLVGDSVGDSLRGGGDLVDDGAGDDAGDSLCWLSDLVCDRDRRGLGDAAAC